MKRIYTAAAASIVLAMVLCIMPACQTEAASGNIYAPSKEIHYTYNGKGKKRKSYLRKFQYYKNGLLKSNSYYEYYDGKAQLQFTLKYFYTDGRIKTVQKWSNGSLQSTDKYEYNEAGLKTAVFHGSPDDLSGEEFYSYNSDGSLKEAVINDYSLHDSDDTVIPAKTTTSYEYNPDGSLRSSTETKEDDTGTSVEKTEYTYKGMKLAKTKTTSTSENGMKNSVVSSFDSAGRIKTIKDTTITALGYKESSKTKNTYNKKGYLAKSTTTWSAFSSVKSKNIYTYKYYKGKYIKQKTFKSGKRKIEKSVYSGFKKVKNNPLNNEIYSIFDNREVFDYYYNY